MWRDWQIFLRLSVSVLIIRGLVQRDVRREGYTCTGTRVEHVVVPRPNRDEKFTLFTPLFPSRRLGEFHFPFNRSIEPIRD